MPWMVRRMKPKKVVLASSVLTSRSIYGVQVAKAVSLLDGNDRTRLEDADFCFCDVTYLVRDHFSSVEHDEHSFPMLFNPHVCSSTTTRTIGEFITLLNRRRSATRARGEHAFHVVKTLWGFAKVRYRGLMKNTVRAVAAYALANLYLARRTLLAPQAQSA